MEMKRKIIEYMEEENISIDYISGILHIEQKKFDKNGDIDWNADDLLKICAFLDLDPMQFYKKRFTA